MNEERLREKAALIENVMDRRRDTDATICVVMERKDEWKWMLFTFLMAFAIGVAFGLIFL